MGTLNKKIRGMHLMTTGLIGGSLVIGLLFGQHIMANHQEKINPADIYISENFSSNGGGVILFSEDVTVPSTVSADFINSRLEGTNMAGLGQAFKKAEKNYGVNAIFLTGLAIHESDYGRSQIAQVKNNLFGFMAYDSSPFSSAGYFESFDACIDYVARYLSQHYLKPDGMYYNGKSIAAINTRYASDKGWSEKIAIRIRTFLNLNK